MSRLLASTFAVSLAAHLAAFAPVLLTLVLSLYTGATPAVYDEGTGTDSFRIEQGILIEGVSQGDAAERVEVAEVAPLVAAEAPKPIVEQKPDDLILKDVIQATESPAEVVKAAEEPPPPEPVKPVEVAAVEQAAQQELFSERSAAKAQDGSRVEARNKYAGSLNKALGRVRIGRFSSFGRVVIQFELDRSGKLISRQVLQSSGDPALDNRALDWMDRAEFPPLPEALNSRELFTVPLEFKRAG